MLAFPLACIVHSQKIDQSINDRSYQSEMMVSMEPETNEFNNTRLSTSATEQKTLTEKQISEEEIKEFLFGEDAVVNAAQPLEADVAEKNGFHLFHPNWESGIRIIRCTDLMSGKTPITWRWKASCSYFATGLSIT